MATTQKVICKCGCGREKEVRTADVKRGWGKFYSKSCKAHHQANNNRIIHGKSSVINPDDTFHTFSCEGLGQWCD